MKTVLAHGCFDLLHLGHIRHLQEAKKLGDRLVVSVTADKFVNKGAGRPHFTEDERTEALRALSCVDEVLINRDPDAVDLIGHLKPAFYVKGGDYRDAADDAALAREAAAVSAIGGDMIFTATRKWSSTQLLEDIKTEPFADYLDVLRRVECDSSLEQIVAMVERVRTNRHRVFFIGNGGSAAIASHMAADFQKAGKVPALCFNDAAQVTALANDLGYDEVFCEPLFMHGRDGDLLFAISSSGQSKSILHAVTRALGCGMKVITLSGFDRKNPLRQRGDVNFYVPSDRYGVVEAAHFVILHSILDALSA